MADPLKIVIRGLPFEAKLEQVCEFFKITEQNTQLLTWPDSGRCKGVAFVECASQQEKQRLEAFEGREFTSEGNTRPVSIVEFEEREPRGRRRNNRREDRGMGQGGQRDRNTRPARKDDAENPNLFEENDETEREVYVSNVSFDATQDDFQAHFADCGEIEDVTIPTLYTSGRPKGFAFVRFATREGRNNALSLDDSQMMNRSIGVRENKGRVQKQRRKKEQRQGLSNKPNGCTTIYVGNLPWNTDEEQLQKAFASKDCGPIASARVVRQSWTKRSRGFGYVEFQNEADVDTAVQMQLTIGDRELRLDYAENLSQ